MLRSKHFKALTGVAVLLLVIVLVTMFGSATIVRQLAVLDAKELARSWTAQMQAHFDMPGTAVAADPQGLDALIALLLDDAPAGEAGVDVFAPEGFQAQQHFGAITGYTVFAPDGRTLIAGGKPVIADVTAGPLGQAFDAARTSGGAVLRPLESRDTAAGSMEAVLVPLQSGGAITGVASIEIERHRFEMVMQRGVQIASTVTAIMVLAVGAMGVILLYDWGRAALKAERRASFLAFADPTTRLPNRRKFEATLPEAVERARAKGVEMAVAFADVDNFKNANEEYGHATGDRLLDEIGQRLRGVLGPRDQVFSMSGDHFAFIIEVPGGTPQIEAFCEAVHEAMAAPLLPDEISSKLSMSTGVARVLTDGETAEQLMQAAELALYRAKSDGRRTYRLFREEMRTEGNDVVRLQYALEQALANDELHLEYQPQVRTGDNKLVGFEALARWTHPTEGPIAPDRFIALAEQSGLITELGEWALETACRDAAEWPEHMSIAVNLSPLQLKDSRLVNHLVYVLEQTGIEPSRLELEVTEGVMMHDTEATHRVFAAIRELGAGLAMDDFGTGYSSLSYLTRIPLTKMKIDKSFIARYGVDERDDAIVDALVKLGRSFGLKITAEGVETSAQARWLSTSGCTSLQGYLFGKPTRDPQAVIDATRRDAHAMMIA